MEQPIEIVAAFCPNCGGRRADVVARHTEVEPIVNVAFCFDVVRCRACDLVFFLAHNDDPDSFGEPVSYPSVAARDRPNWMAGSYLDFNAPPVWKERLADFYGCLDAGLLVPAAVAARTAFDVASSALGVETTLSFEKKLNALADLQMIALADRDNLQTLIEAGSAAAHRGWEPELSQLHLIADILEGFLERAFIQNQAAADLLSKIPQRQR